MNDTQWAIFRRLANNPSLSSADSRDLRTLARAATLAGRADAEEHRLVRLHQARITLSTATDDTHKTAERQAWTDTLHAFLDPAQKLPTTFQIEEVFRVMALTLYQRLPWPPGNWPEMIRRQEQFIEELLAGTRQIRPNILRYETPPGTPWSTHTRRGYTLTPLNTSNRELAASVILEFPIRHDNEDAANEPAMTFIARAPGRSPAAIRLNLQNGRWMPAEIMLAHGERTTRALRGLADNLAAAIRTTGKRGRARTTRRAPEIPR